MAGKTDGSSSKPRIMGSFVPEPTVTQHGQRSAHNRQAQWLNMTICGVASILPRRPPARQNLLTEAEQARPPDIPRQVRECGRAVQLCPLSVHDTCLTILREVPLLRGKETRLCVRRISHPSAFRTQRTKQPTDWICSNQPTSECMPCLI